MLQLLVAATVMEIEPVLKQLNRPGGIKTPTDVLITGVGIPSATWHLTRYLAGKQPQLIIQAGIAGCFRNTVPLTKVFSVKSDLFGDLGVMEKGVWQDVFDMGFSSPSGFPFSRKELRNPDKTLLKQTGLPTAKAITVNTISSGKKQAEQRQAHYGALLESMEGAALHYVALQEGIPFLQIRSVSNYCGERNKKKWDVPGAIQSLNRALTAIIE